MCAAAFRRLCVETGRLCGGHGQTHQPPSGGCVLKHSGRYALEYLRAAAFRRLCVETRLLGFGQLGFGPAAFRRLCVETRLLGFGQLGFGPAAFRRLCVETLSPIRPQAVSWQPPSGGCVLKQNGLDSVSPTYGTAAFRRLCVETSTPSASSEPSNQPPSGGCVLKPHSSGTFPD